MAKLPDSAVLELRGSGPWTVGDQRREDARFDKISSRQTSRADNDKQMAANRAAYKDEQSPSAKPIQSASKQIDRRELWRRALQKPHAEPDRT